MSEDEIIQYIEEHFDEVYKESMEDCGNDEEIFVYQYIIKKFKKEMEQEKEKNKELENADLTTVYMNGFYDGEEKWKDKIKAKIKELENLIETNSLYEECWNKIEVLKELLED